MQMQETILSEKIDVDKKIANAKKRKVVFKPYNQNQNFLLPKNVNDYVSSGHISRLISTLADNMDIEFITNTYKGGGTSSYDARMMLKLWILAFVYRIYSCRQLAKATRENLPFIWISGNQNPDFRTLNNFRLKLKDDIKKVFKEIVKYGIETGIIEGKDVFIDHTKKEANANKYKMVWRKQVERQQGRIDEELDELFKYVDKLNEKEDTLFGKKDLPEQERQGFDDNKVKGLIDAINNKVKNKTISSERAREERKNVRRTRDLVKRKKQYEKKKENLGKRNSYSKTDNDAVAMMMKDKLTVRPGYNEGIAVEKGFVLDYVISDNCSDGVSFIPLMDGVIDNIGKNPESATSDAAYGNEENHSYIEKKGIGNYLRFGTYHKEKSKKWMDERMRLTHFNYDKDKDEFTCKNGVKLKFYEMNDETTKTGYVKKVKKYKAEEGSCTACPFRAKCTNSKVKTLQVSWKAEKLKEDARENLNSEKGKVLRKRRGNEVESVFGDGKMNRNKHRYNLRGLKKVNIEAGLYYISHNVRKIYKFMTETTRKQITDVSKQTFTDKEVNIIC